MKALLCGSLVAAAGLIGYADSASAAGFGVYVGFGGYPTYAAAPVYAAPRVAYSPVVYQPAQVVYNPAPAVYPAAPVAYQPAYPVGRQRVRVRYRPLRGDYVYRYRGRMW